MKYRYAKESKIKLTHGKGTGRGRGVRPNEWITGPDEFTHEIYYAWLKHRAQARFRRECYNLSWDEWRSIWDKDSWNKRGRSSKSLCLAKIDPTEPWQIDNCELITRETFLRKARNNSV